MTFATTDYALPAKFPDCHPKGRICAAEGCGTVVSIWNPNETCWRCTTEIEREVRRVAARFRRQERLTPEERRERDQHVLRLLAEEVPRYEVAEMFGTSPQTVTAIASRGRHERVAA